MNPIYINEELGVRVIDEEGTYNLNVQLRFGNDKWVNVDSYNTMSNDYAYTSAREAFKRQCENRKKQNEDKRNRS